LNGQDRFLDLDPKRWKSGFKMEQKFSKRGSFSGFGGNRRIPIPEIFSAT
jgi:hypothetical protein